MAACSAQDTREISFAEYSVFEVNEFLSAENDEFVGRPTRIVAGGDGLYFSDHGFQQITSVNSIGQKGFSFGSQGEGPGEFSAPSRFWVFDESYLVYDYNSFKFILYDSNGDLIEETIVEKNPVNPDGFPPNIPLTAHAISPHTLLIPSRGRNGSLFAIADIKTGEMEFAGKAVGEHVESYNSDEVQRAYSNGEIPEISLNMTALSGSSPAIYSFQQTTGVLEKYSLTGELIWDKQTRIPAQDELFERIARHNLNVDTSTEWYQPFIYAWTIDANEYGVALHLNVPEEEPVTAAWIPADGSEMKLISFPGLNSEVSGLFGTFTVSPDNSRVYFLNNQDGVIYEAEWPV